MAKQVANGIEAKIAVIANDISYIKQELAELKESIKDGYVTRSEFEPVKKIVYGLITLVLTAVVGAILGLVLIQK